MRLRAIRNEKRNYRDAARKVTTKMPLKRKINYVILKSQIEMQWIMFLSATINKKMICWPLPWKWRNFNHWLHIMISTKLILKGSTVEKIKVALKLFQDLLHRLKTMIFQNCTFKDHSTPLMLKESKWVESVETLTSQTTQTLMLCICKMIQKQRSFTSNSR